MSTSSQSAVFDLASLRSAILAGWRPSYLFFWGHRSGSANPGKHVLSQWWPAAFTIEGETFWTAEHYMMAEKARLFGDTEAYARIVTAPDPSEAKALGRKVRGFVEEVWKAHRYDIAMRGNIAKFNQHPALGQWLVSTKEDVLVEASPVDTVWGIGLSVDDQRAQDPALWQGLNLLGFALMRVRASIAR